MKNRNFDHKVISKLANELSKYPSIRRYDEGESLEAWSIAHSLSDLEKSFCEIIENHLVALLQTKNEEQASDVLLDIGEELRHILYHIRDMKFFTYLEEKGEEKEEEGKEKGAVPNSPG